MASLANGSTGTLHRFISFRSSFLLCTWFRNPQALPQQPPPHPLHFQLYVFFYMMIKIKGEVIKPLSFHTLLSTRLYRVSTLNAAIRLHMGRHESSRPTRLWSSRRMLFDPHDVLWNHFPPFISLRAV